MYGLAFTLALVALVAAILGFGGVAGVMADVALIVFIIALIGTIIFLVLGWKAAKKIGKGLQRPHFQTSSGGQIAATVLPAVNRAAAPTAGALWGKSDRSICSVDRSE